MQSDFIQYQAQTTPHPLGLEISYAAGSYLYDSSNKPYLDFIAGVSACPLGHRHPRVVEAIEKQLKKYLHVMVYGEFIQKPALELSKLLAENLPDPLETTYLTNSGTEAVEGALKLAKRITGRAKVVAADKGYHGNTMGAMSVMGFESRKRAYRPLIPDSEFISFNDFQQLDKIDRNTAAVILETIQGGAGFIVPKEGYLKAVRKRCDEVGALLILDEIQPGMGRTGKLFSFEHYHCVPDILVSGKGLGGGMPIGAFTSSSEKMRHLSNRPKLGHITTFGGHPLIAAAALSTLKELTTSTWIAQAIEKEKLIRNRLKHPLINEIRGKGLMLAIVTPSAEIASQVVLKCLEKGLILFWLLFEPLAVRITPPLTISDKEIDRGCSIILEVMNALDEKMSSR